MDEKEEGTLSQEMIELALAEATPVQIYAEVIRRFRLELEEVIGMAEGCLGQESPEKLEEQSFLLRKQLQTKLADEGSWVTQTSKFRVTVAGMMAEFDEKVALLALKRSME